MGKLSKPPLQPSHVWSIRTKLQMEGLKRDLALFNLPEWLLAHCRHVSRDNLLAMIGKPHPRLALAADEIVSAHLELEVDRGEVAPERQNLQADAVFLDAGAGWAC